MQNPSNQGFLGPCPDDRAQRTIQSSRAETFVRPNLTLIFQKQFRIVLFFTLLVPPQKSMAIQTFRTPLKTPSLGPCLNDRAQKPIPSSREETSVRPNPTLDFSSIRFQFRPPSSPLEICHIQINLI